MATMLKLSLAILMLLGAVMVVVTMDVYGCYQQPDSPCSNFTITCEVGTRIIFYALQYYTKLSINICPPLQDKDDCNTSQCCTRNSSDRNETFSRQDSYSVYTACTNQKSCTITSPYTPNSNTPYHYVHYGYNCTPVSLIYNMATTSTKSSENGFLYLYYGGRAPPAIDSSCSCNANATAISIQYINLGVETCNRVNVLLDYKPIYNCTGEPVFIPRRSLKAKHLQINITQYKPSYGDAILMLIKDESGTDSVQVSCDCDNVVSAKWSEWSSFSPCSVSCGNGSMIRTRTCNNPVGDGAANCGGNSNQTTMCNQLPCFGMDGSWSEWSSVSNCSVTCGGGTKLKTRQCNNPTSINEGASCTGPSYKNQVCNTSTCTGTYVPWIVSGVAILVILVIAIIWFIRLIRTRINKASLYDTPTRQSTAIFHNQEYTELQPRVIDDDHVCSHYLALVNTTNEYAPFNAGTRDDVHYKTLQPPPESDNNPVSLSNYVNISNQHVISDGIYINPVHERIY